MDVKLPDKLEEGINQRQEKTGQTKAEITRSALVRELRPELNI